MAATPVSVITGFLGSGKTTLLNRLLRDPAMRGAAVIVNEFGEIGIDHLLVEAAIEDAVLLRSGCICCTVRGDLVDTLGSLDARRAAGELPAFDRAVVETTGLADPAPILQTLMSDPSLTPRYRLGAVVTTVDALHAPTQLARFGEAVKQVAVA
ncbi:MAG: GTP-binding protein, partial [Alphaproteobacteria bacterium]|nr:GTP-binding protein [Alphaproteobacteria bacterium]